MANGENSGAVFPKASYLPHFGIFIIMNTLCRAYIVQIFKWDFQASQKATQYLKDLLIFPLSVFLKHLNKNYQNFFDC